MNNVWSDAFRKRPKTKKRACRKIASRQGQRLEMRAGQIEKRRSRRHRDDVVIVRRSRVADELGQDALRTATRNGWDNMEDLHDCVKSGSATTTQTVSNADVKLTSYERRR
jgi:hypothetical protein